MNQQSSKKTWIISIGVILAAILAYYTFFSGTPAPASSGLLEATPQNNLVGAQVLSLLNQIRSLQIDTSFFKNPAYLSLQDYTIQIPPVNVGRPNPFAPLPGLRMSSTPAH